MASSGSPLTTLHRWGFGNLKVWASLHKYEKYQQAKIAKNKGWASKLQVGVVRQRRTHSCLTLPSTRGYTIFPSSTEECRKKYTFPKLPLFKNVRFISTKLDHMYDMATFTLYKNTLRKHKFNTTECQIDIAISVNLFFFDLVLFKQVRFNYTT